MNKEELEKQFNEFWEKYHSLKNQYRILFIEFLDDLQERYLEKDIKFEYSETEDWNNGAECLYIEIEEKENVDMDEIEDELRQSINENLYYNIQLYIGTNYK
jgi:hypothetical protein